MLNACKLFSMQFALPHTTNCCGIQSHKYTRGKKNKVINYYLPNFRAIAQDNEDNQTATVSYLSMLTETTASVFESQH